MGEIYINYNMLEDSIKKSQKVRGELSDYVDEIKKRITTPVSELSGSDSSGYASTASSLAWKKINSLNEKANRFSAYERTVSSLISKAESKDTYVSNQIETIAGMYIEKRTWYQKAGDWIYNTFCVELVNKWDWARDLADVAKWIHSKVDNALDAVADWFKYGDGKYVLNILSAVGKVAAAVAATCVAIAAIPFTGGATLPIVIGCIAAAASGISAIITIVNAEATITSNTDAILFSGNLFKKDDGNPSAARYYGGVSSLSDKWKKTDMGDAKTNKAYSIGGDIIDTAKVVADTTYFVCGIILGAAAFRDYRYNNPGEHIKRYDFSLKNLLHTLKGEFGFYLTKPGLVIKDHTKLIPTGIKIYNDAKDTIDYFSNQFSEIITIWKEERVHTGQVQDPFKELGSIWDNIKGFFGTAKEAFAK